MNRCAARLFAAGASCVLLLPALLRADAAALPSAIEAGWRGERVCEVLFADAAMRVARCTFPPGGGHERHSHPRHWGYILAGSTMRTTSAAGTVTRELRTGASWHSEGIAWHEVENVGTTTGIYLIVEPLGPDPQRGRG